MAYCVGALVEILDQVLDPKKHHKNWVLDHDKIPQIQSLFEHASFVRDFLAKSSPSIQDRIESLEDQTRDVAEKAEDILKSLITNQLLSSPIGQSFTISPTDLQEVIEVFEYVKMEMSKIKDDSSDTDQTPDNEPRVVSSRRDPNPKNIMVGVEKDVIQLKDRLIGRSSKLEIIPIVGMGGTGKTTLARMLYDEYSSSKSHFDIFAWATVSKNCNPRSILLNLIDCVAGKPTHAQGSTEDLITTLYKSLFSRRYLIVLDDVWSSKAFDDVQTAFPRDSQRSRIILTTRENIVADYVNPKSHPMHLLNKDDSWELLKKKVFGEKHCPRELEEVGERIAEICGGLPLAIQVIGGFLSQGNKSKDFFDKVAHEVSSIIAREDEQFSGIFSWSFANLPHYLKPCFLYMGGFPEDYNIPASKVTKLWVAEGFLNPIGDKTLEEAAEIYLEALIDRNLIFVRERKRGGGVKSYGIHDLLRDLSMKKAEEKKFLYFKRLEINYFAEDTLCRGRVTFPQSYHTLCAFYNLDTQRARGFERTHGDITREWILRFPPFCTRLLNVLDIVEINFRVFPNEILQLVNLRLLAISCPSIPDISTALGNLQTIVGKFSFANSSMLKMPQLRHVKFTKVRGVMLFVSLIKSFGVLEKLQTLSTIPLETFILLLGKIPNLRKLGIHSDTDTSSHDAINLTCFPKLEILRCSASSLRGTSAFLSNLIFPDSLKKLHLVNFTVPLTVLSTIGKLPNLEVLTVVACFLDNSTWEPTEGEFCVLQYLQLSVPNLVNWLADETHFPQLQHLVLENCNRLEEFPLDIGGIQTLEIIEVKECKPSIVVSVRLLVEEQNKNGNESLQFRYKEKPWYESSDEEDDFA